MMKDAQNEFQKYLDDNELGLADFCRKVGLKYITIWRIMKRLSSHSRLTALKIEKGTNGFVTKEMFGHASTHD
jgi:predicted transcriptional regulator